MRSRLVRPSLLALAALLALPLVGLVLLLLQIGRGHLVRYDRSNPDYRCMIAALGAMEGSVQQMLNSVRFRIIHL